MGLNECTFLLLSCINLVKPIQSNTGYLEKKVIKQYNQAINKAALKYDVSPYLLLALLKVESNFGQNTTSKTNDHGPMQVNEWWFDRLKISKKTVDSPDGAMYVAAKILSMAKEDTGGKGCWWSVYNSTTPKNRKKYERDVLQALDTLGFKTTCNTSEFLYDWSSAKAMTAQLKIDAGAKLAANNIKI